MTRNAAFGLLFLALIVPAAWRAVSLAATPPFEPGVPQQLLPRLFMDGVELVQPVPDGAVRVRARSLAAGAGGATALFPGTAGRLEDVEAVRFKDGVETWALRARAAGLTSRRLEVDGSAVFEPAGEPARRHAGAVVHLRTGELILR